LRDIKPFNEWFAARGWQPRAHQLQMLEHGLSGESALLISPTGGGKTLAGFLPTLVELSTPHETHGIHTLYISPLKALAVDIARNLDAPIAEMNLPISVETRTGDTPHSRRQRQRIIPPDILITTPEQVSLLIADPTAHHPRDSQGYPRRWLILMLCWLGFLQTRNWFWALRVRHQIFIYCNQRSACRGAGTVLFMRFLKSMQKSKRQRCLWCS
jgi:hypothetical protein